MNELLSKDYIVEKSKPLIWAKFSEYSLFEMRLIDTYLSKINARNEDTSEVTFSVNEYLTLLGYAEPEKVTTKRLQKTLEKFLSTKIKIDLDAKGKNYRLVNLFSDACVITDHPDFNKRTITIDCNPKLKQAFFDISEKGYIEYKLDYSLRLNSKYAIKLYALLKDKMQLRQYEWSVDLKELRELIGATNKNNESFREFNKVLYKCKEDINSVTDLEFEYEKLTRGRLTRGIFFKIIPKNYRRSKIIDAPADELPVPQEKHIYWMYYHHDVPKWPEQVEMHFDQKYYYRVNRDAFKEEFDPAAAEYLISLGSKMAAKNAAGIFDVERQESLKVEYYQQQYLAMNAKATSKEMKPRFAYLKKILIGDFAEHNGLEYDKKTKTYKGNHENKFGFEARNYDMDELEAQLLAL